MVNGRLASLNRFLSRSAQRSLPFLKILKEKTTKGKDIKWTPDAEAAFQDLKAHLLQLPTLTTPLPGETLFVYLAVSTDSISTVLIRDDRGVQRPVYFVSKLLQGAEMRYSEVEKLALALPHDGSATTSRPIPSTSSLTILFVKSCSSPRPPAALSNGRWN